MDKGLDQAIDNLVYHIVNLSNESVLPEVEDNPWLAEMDIDDQVKFFEKTLESDEIEKWDYLGKIFHVVCDTYNITIEELRTHVEFRLINHPSLFD